MRQRPVDCRYSVPPSSTRRHQSRSAHDGRARVSSSTLITMRRGHARLTTVLLRRPAAGIVGASVLKSHRREIDQYDRAIACLEISFEDQRFAAPDAGGGVAWEMLPCPYPAPIAMPSPSPRSNVRLPVATQSQECVRACRAARRRAHTIHVPMTNFAPRRRDLNLVRT
jgi:hypothetical protein